MNLTIEKQKLYPFLFVLCVGVPYLDNYELTFLIWSFTALVSVQLKYSLSLIKQLFCFTAVILIAFFSSFFYSYENYLFIRDVTYLIKPILG
ncbi:MAG: hypothetical protein Q8K02_06330, partial [Flavobacterium sp.]|nr:hypothetical protein [Flavobacterium sp.]